MTYPRVTYPKGSGAWQSPYHTPSCQLGFSNQVSHLLKTGFKNGEPRTMLQEIESRISATISGWDCPLLTEPSTQVLIVAQVILKQNPTRALKLVVSCSRFSDAKY